MDSGFLGNANSGGACSRREVGTSVTLYLSAINHKVWVFRWIKPLSLLRDGISRHTDMHLIDEYEHSLRAAAIARRIQNAVFGHT